MQEVYDGVPPVQFLQNVKSVCLARTRRDCVVSKSFRSSGKTAEEEVRLGDSIYFWLKKILREEFSCEQSLVHHLPGRGSSISLLRRFLAECPDHISMSHLAMHL